MSSPGLIEGAELQSVYDTFVKALTGAGLPAHMRQLARWALVRIGAYELADRLCDFKTFGEWMMGSRYPFFLQQLPRVRSHEDRLALMEQHKRWAADLEAKAAPGRIVLPPARKEGKLRLGLISSNLNAHVVGHLALPLFDHPDERFELYAYSTVAHESDSVRERMEGKSILCNLASLTPYEAAQLISEDDLDMLVELDGITGEHVLEVMAFKPARLQASWLGYPHSTGLSTIDYIILDPHLRTPLLLERPLLMPQSWVALSDSKFSDRQAIAAQSPEARNGFLTFGTLNNPYKFTVDSLRSWARILARVPGSKFLFARPEAGAPSFQRGMRLRFEAEGVSADRLLFAPQRGRHMDFYNEIDIALDTFPLTGGTTTAETLWMGVPVVSLVGEGLPERLSYSMLLNAGLPDLAVTSMEDYETAAIALANDPERRGVLRRELRDSLKAGPLGQSAQFAKDFYDLMASAIRTSSSAA